MKVNYYSRSCWALLAVALASAPCWAQTPFHEVRYAKAGNGERVRISLTSGITGTLCGNSSFAPWKFRIELRGGYAGASIFLTKVSGGKWARSCGSSGCSWKAVNNQEFDSSRFFLKVQDRQAVSFGEIVVAQLFGPNLCAQSGAVAVSEIELLFKLNEDAKGISSSVLPSIEIKYPRPPEPDLLLVIGSPAALSAAAPLIQRRQVDYREVRTASFIQGLVPLDSTRFCCPDPHAVPQLRHLISSVAEKCEGANKSFDVLLIGDACPELPGTNGTFGIRGTRLGGGASFRGYNPIRLIARIPVKDADDMRSYFNKVVRYESRLPTKRVLTIVDDDIQFGTEVGTSSAGVLENQGADVVKLFFRDLDFDPMWSMEERRFFVESTVLPRLADILGRGLDYIFFLGHGWTWVWARETLFSTYPGIGSEDNPLLQPTSRPPVVFSWSCRTADVSSKESSGVGEVLVRDHDGGAIGFIGSKENLPSGFSLAAEQVSAQAVADNPVSLGDLFTNVKYELKVVLAPRFVPMADNLVLLGDPGLRLEPGDTQLNRLGQGAIE